MAYDLHIERIGSASERIPVRLEDWRSAISSLEGVRLAKSQTHSITNPRTGEVLSIPLHEGDAEVYFPDNGTWGPVFLWMGESASFSARFEPGDVSHPVWNVAVNLASCLGAVIRGDEGEIYDLETGETLDA